MKKASPPAAAAFRQHGKPRLLPEVGIPLLYLVFASAWIVISDLWLGQKAVDVEESVMIQLFKGLNFVVTSTALLYFVLRRSYGGWRRAEICRLAVVQESSERFRALSFHVEKLREEERIRIAREVHDELGQFLTAIKMEVRMLEDRLTERNDRTLHPEIDRLVEISVLVDETITSVQRIACDLRPGVLDHIGLDAAMQDEAARFSQRFGIESNVMIEELTAPLPPDITTAAFRIFQEALTNVARHAHAKRITVALDVCDNRLQLSIQDDGIGIDPTILEAPSSLGLTGMLERAAHAGGELTISPRECGGTEVFLTIPVVAEGLPASANPLTSAVPPS